MLPLDLADCAIQFASRIVVTRSDRADRPACRQAEIRFARHVAASTNVPKLAAGSRSPEDPASLPVANRRSGFDGQ
jgi:hypothetical protein